MKKIRINELARELEVKPQRILDALPELGVAEKKTHSSSLDDDVADLVRRHFGADGAGAQEPREAHVESTTDDSVAVAEGLETTEAPAPQRTAADQPAAIAEAEPEGSGAAESGAEAQQEAPAAAAPEPGGARSRPAPIRPPLAGRAPAPTPGTPATPTIRPSAPAAPRQPIAQRPPAAQRPAASAATPATPSAPRPGQILSTRPAAPTGPRQPLPGSVLGPPGTA